MRHPCFRLGQAALFLLVLQGIFLSCAPRSGPGGTAPILSAKADSIDRKIRALNREGTELRNESRYRDALSVHFQALNLAEEQCDTSGQIFALNNIGTDLRRTSSYSEASVYHYAALELCGSHPQYQKSRAVAMNGLGNIFLSLDKPEEALSYLRQSLQIEKELGSKLGEAMNLANIAESFRIQKALDSALSYYNASMLCNESIGSDIGIAICLNEIGEIYLEQGRTQAGMSLIKRAVQLLENSKDAYHRSMMENSYCRALMEHGLWEEAAERIDEVLELAHILSSYEQLYIAYGMLARLMEHQGKPSEAIQASRNTMVYHDSLLSQNNEVRILELENRYKSRQFAKQIQLLEAERILTRKTENERRLIFYLVIFILCLLSMFSYYRERNRRQLAAELEKIDKIKSRFFADISHEFRTPLTLIKSPVEHLLENNADPAAATDLNIVLRNTNHMLFLVEQLMNISKLDAGKFTIHIQPDDLARTIRSISDSFVSLASMKSLSYRREIVDSGLVWFDPNIVQILVVNLLSNAMKFSPEKGDVFLRTRMLEDGYEFSLENDTMRDFTDNELSQIFDRFHTTSKEVYGGTGIGLALIKEICALYQARIDVHYSERRIRFTILLPVDKAVFRQEGSFSDEIFIGDDGGPASDPEAAYADEKEAPIVLVVEDNDDMRLFLRNILEDDYRVLTATNGKEGIEKACENVPDLILSDVLMPDGDGLELCTILKSDVRTSHVPIILLTALGRDEDIENGLACKADDYIVKPFNAKLLMAKIRNQLRYRDVLIRKYREASKTDFLTEELPVREKRFSDLLEQLSGRFTDPDFGVDEFCQACLMSRTQLHRKLKATTGLSATAYLRSRRIRIAAEILKRPESNVSDACFGSGFRDASYFSKRFRDEMGMSPAAFRKKHLS